MMMKKTFFNLTSKVSKDDSFQNSLAPGESTFRRFFVREIFMRFPQRSILTLSKVSNVLKNRCFAQYDILTL